jgi:hypothetical protein
MMRSPQLLLTGRAPKFPPSSRAHHWATPTCHNSCSTQACPHTIKSTSKAWATKAQQDWPINMAIDSRLLACKGWIGETLYYVELMLRVDHYFQVLALLNIIPLLAFINQLYSNHYNWNLLIKLIKQELQQVITVRHLKSILSHKPYN